MAYQPIAYAVCRSGREPGPVECWLRIDFSSTFGSTLSEPLPADLVVLAADLFH